MCLHATFIECFSPANLNATARCTRYMIDTEPVVKSLKFRNRTLISELVDVQLPSKLTFRVMSASPSRCLCAPQCMPCSGLSRSRPFVASHRRASLAVSVACQMNEREHHNNYAPLNSGPCGDLLSGGCWVSRTLLYGSLSVGAITPIAILLRADQVGCHFLVVLAPVLHAGAADLA